MAPRQPRTRGLHGRQVRVSILLEPRQYRLLLDHVGRGRVSEQIRHIIDHYYGEGVRP